MSAPSSDPPSQLDGHNYPPYLSKLLIGVLAGLVLLNLGIFFADRETTIPISARPKQVLPATERAHSSAILGQLDLERIHSYLLPAWALARIGEDAKAIIRLQMDLMDSLQEEPILTEIIRALQTSSEDASTTSASAILPLCWAWNQHLDLNEAPWRIHCNMVRRDPEQWFYLSSYQVLADVAVDMDGQSQRVRLLRRMDRTGAREPYLGHAGTRAEGALLVLDRIRDFAMDSVWPILDPSGDGDLTAMERALAPQVRSELRRTVGDEHMPVLERTAGIRLEMLRIWRELEPVRACQGKQSLRLPWSGPTEETLLPLSLNTQQGCPLATPDQLGELLQLTDRIASEAQLLPALDRLVAWAAHPVTLHEARHLADRSQDGAEGPPCPGCTTDLDSSERSELSAYLSTLTHPSMANTARLQACVALADLAEDSIHARALREIQDQDLEGMCTEPLPDFVRASQRAMARLLGRSPSSQLPEDFPRRLPVALEPPRPELSP